MPQSLLCGSSPRNQLVGTSQVKHGHCLWAKKWLPLHFKHIAGLLITCLNFEATCVQATKCMQACQLVGIMRTCSQGRITSLEKKWLTAELQEKAATLKNIEARLGAEYDILKASVSEVTAKMEVSS